jgi:predicted nucleic acid-binding protein
LIVFDASAIVDLLLNLPPRAEHVRQRITEEAPDLHAPHLVDAEIAQVLRRFVLRGELTPEEAVSALDDLAGLPIARYPHAPFLERAFELRDNTTVYDALYLVLAEVLGAPLLTSDTALADVPGHRARIELTDSTGR